MIFEGDQSRGLEAGGMICARDKAENKKKKKVQTFPEQCKMTTGLEQENSVIAGLQEPKKEAKRSEEVFIERER